MHDNPASQAEVKARQAWAQSVINERVNTLMAQGIPEDAAIFSVLTALVADTPAPFNMRYWVLSQPTTSALQKARICVALAAEGKNPTAFDQRVPGHPVLDALVTAWRSAA
jgi:hypothetical protein